MWPWVGSAPRDQGIHEYREPTWPEGLLVRSELGDVHFYAAPWVNGTRATQYFGPISASVTITNIQDADKALETVLMEVSSKAVDLGANAIIGYEVQIEIHYSGEYRLFILGTAALLEAYF